MNTFIINKNIYNYLIDNKEEFINILLDDIEFNNYMFDNKNFNNLKFHNFEKNSKGDGYIIYSYRYGRSNIVSNTTLILFHNKFEILAFDNFVYEYFKHLLLTKINNMLRVKKIKEII